MSRRADKTGSTAAAPRKALIQTLTGRVVSDKMDKTVTVLVERRVKHPLYGKIVTQSQQVPRARREQRVQEGDLVEIAAMPAAVQDQGVAGRRSCWKRRRRSEQRRAENAALPSVSAWIAEAVNLP